MSKFKVIPLTADYADQIRSAGVDHFGNTVVEQVATGYGPCRVSLKPFVPGVDKRLLLSHSPFEQQNAFNQQGPIFIHTEPVEPYADVDRFPPEIKADKENFPLTLIGYSPDQRMVFAQLVGDSDVDLMIDAIFDTHENVDYLHVRNAEAGCFICKIERNG
ncbi:MAG: DUF1203 domain-containing protein [Bacteroidota bacterium]